MSAIKTTSNDLTGNRKRRVILFFISLTCAAGVTWLIHEPEFTQAQISVLFLLLFSVGLWLTEAVPPFSVGLLIIAFLAYALGYEQFTSTPSDISIYTNTFSSSVIWLMLGGFFLASAMTKTKLDADLIRVAVKVCGTNPKWILLGMMAVTMIASMLISNTATTAMVVAALMPILKKSGKGSKVVKAFLLGVSIAATTGGMCTIIGSPPNAIAAGALVGANHPIDFVRWMYFGMPVAIVLTFIVWWLLVRVFITEASVFSIDIPETKVNEDNAVSRVDRWIVMVTLFITLILWLTNAMHGLSVAAVSAIPLVFLPLTRVVNGEDIRAMAWDTLLLVAGGLALGAGLQETGLLNLYASRITSLQASAIPTFFLLGYATMLFSNIMSNTATSTVLIPLGMAILPTHQLEVAMIIGLSASTALFLPVSTPPNAIAYSTGLIEQKDFRMGGILIGLLGPALIVLWVLLIA